MRFNARTAALLLLLTAPAALFPACGGSDEEEIRAARLLEGCLINSDCSDPLVCVFRKCHKQCATSRDCDEGERCVAGEDGTNVCQPDILCTYNSQCPGIQVCATDGECRDQCAADRDCVEEQVCTAGVCAEPAELVDGGLPPADTGPEQGRPCSYNSECPQPLACIEGQCMIECYEDRDCIYGLVCFNNRCSLPQAVPDGGAGGSGVDASAGFGGQASAAGGGGSSGGGAASGGGASGGGGAPSGGGGASTGGAPSGGGGTPGGGGSGFGGASAAGGTGGFGGTAGLGGSGGSAGSGFGGSSGSGFGGSSGGGGFGGSSGGGGFGGSSGGGGFGGSSGGGGFGGSAGLPFPSDAGALDASAN
jgi:hypothetical protein